VFLLVCQGMQHAHQKGIIHRDIKPTNVLVMAQDGVAVPKIIDFGVAKAIHQRLTEQSTFTHHGQMIGTPLYMSPEQAETDGQHVDTRTDIYSLGVMLYELSTGLRRSRKNVSATRVTSRCAPQSDARIRRGRARGSARWMRRKRRRFPPGARLTA